MSEKPMSSLRMSRMFGLSRVAPFFTVLNPQSLRSERWWLAASGMSPGEIDAETEILRQIDRTQQFQRPSVGVDGQTFHGQQSAAGRHAKQLGAGGVGERGADGLHRLLDIEFQLFLEHPVHHDRD